MSAYYNEFDPGAAAWLRDLIKRGLIADGEVDDRSILDVRPVDLAGFTQCHFFAGIGGWSYALRLAGWPDDRPVWTGSPPCQPFSAAGQQRGRDDERHLAPHFVELVRACRPPVLCGEQVASAQVFGGAAKRVGGAAASAPAWAWLDDLSDRLEAAHYAVGASDIPAAGVGAPHIRQRTFFGAVRLADATGERHLGFDPLLRPEEGRRNAGTLPQAARSGATGRLADSDDAGLQGRQRAERADERLAWADCVDGGLADAQGEGRADGAQINGGSASVHGEAGEIERTWHRGASGGSQRPSPPDSPWGTPDWLFCRDGKWRPVESGTQPLAHGLPARVGRLRGYGNAIVPQAAAEFVGAFLQALDGGET